jgi:hypothetical protein
LFEADLLENLSHAAQVLERAHAMLGTINGYFRTVHPNWQPLFACGVSRIEDDRPRTQFVLPLPLQVTTIVLEPTLLKEGDPPPEPQDLAYMIDDPELSRVLRLYSLQPLDWVNMYRIYESIRATDRPLLQRCVSAGDQSRFTHTANSPAAAGDNARHGRLSGTPPSNPMSENDARSMIAKLVEAYCRKRRR